MNGERYRNVAFLVFALIAVTLSAGPSPTELFLRGHSVLPAPRHVALQPGEIELDGSWTWAAEGLAAEHIAVRFLTADLREFHSIELRPSRGRAEKRVRLLVRAGAVRTGAAADINGQAYRLRVAPREVEVVGNGEAGLLYGVQTLVQLVKRGPAGGWRLPSGVIEDWPEHPLRFLHWDTKHHQDRLETLERYIDWAVRFKANRIGFELEDKLAYPSHPVVGAPGAFSVEQLQELTRYGLERHVQIVPQIQAPAHMAYVLKHPEFAELRADGNNYQSDICDARTYDLIFSLYEDAIRGTPGVDAFFASTDEVYYAGIGARCPRPYNAENRSLAWVEFARRSRDFLARHARTMLAWVESPLLPGHAALLPRDIVNGNLTDDSDLTRAQNAAGLNQLVYASMQGEEYLFPNYLALEGERPAEGRLAAAFEALSVRPWHAHRIGVYGAAWDDAGLHNETFWLGWAAVAAWGWSPGTPSPEQALADFVRIYYGPEVTGLAQVYSALQGQARFFQRSWDRVVSRVRSPGYGNSNGPGIGTTRYDFTLPPPPLPARSDLSFEPVDGGGYAARAQEARRLLGENEILTMRLLENIPRARNRYNLEVLLSLARLTRHHERLISSLVAIEDRLRSAREAARAAPAEAVRHLVGAHAQARMIVEERHATLRALKAVWEKSRLSKGASVGGKSFRHVLDDTKDHWADRRPDLTYLTASEESIGLETWADRLADVVREYARQQGLPAPELEAVGRKIAAGRSEGPRVDPIVALRHQ